MVQAVQSLRSVQFPRLNPHLHRGGGQRWGLNGFNGLNGLNLQGRYIRKTVAFVAYSLLSLTSAFAQAPFYQGKTITVIAFTAPGGSGDLRVKAMIPFLKKHIPGNSTVVIEYMDGGRRSVAAAIN